MRQRDRLHWVLLCILLIKRINNYNTAEFHSVERHRIKGEIYVCLICPLISLKFLPLLICFIARLRQACWVTKPNQHPSHAHTLCNIPACREMQEINFFFLHFLQKMRPLLCVFREGQAKGQLCRHTSTDQAQTQHVRRWNNVLQPSCSILIGSLVGVRHHGCSVH